MSFMKGDLLTKTRHLVRGLAKAEPLWLKAMEKAPPVVFPRSDGKVQQISLPEDKYVKKLFQKYPEAKHDDAIKIRSFEPVPARIYGLRVLELKEQGATEEEAMKVAGMEYRAQRKARKMAYKRLKQIAKVQGKEPPPNPFPSAIKEIQKEEWPYIRERFTNPEALELVDKMQAEKDARMQDRFGGALGGRN